MADPAVPWRRAVAVLAGVAIVLGGIVLVLRSDGFSSVDATVPRATRWFVDQTRGRVVLADGFSGRALARLDVGDDGAVIDVVQGAAGTAVVDRAEATAREIDAAELRLGPARSVSVLAASESIVGIGQTGLVAIDPTTSQALLVPPGGGDTVPFQVDGAGLETLVAPDSSVWTISGGSLVRATTTGEVTVATGVATGRFSLVGSRPLLFDPGGGRVRFDDGEWVDLPTDADASEVVLQEPGPSAPCGWVAANDDLWCVGPGGIERTATIAGLDVDGADWLAIAGDAGALVRRAPLEIVRIDWRNERVIVDGGSPSVPDGSELAVSAATDLIWIDQTNGSLLWAVNPWGVHAISKNDNSAPLLGDDGRVVEEGTQGAAATRAAADAAVEAPFEPDENGIDDPPIAIDDPVTARTGAPVSIRVTANDRDPDGEAIAVVATTRPEDGSVEIVDASTVLYTPQDGFVGIDSFDYTIVDGNGTEASATVTIELLPLDATNQAPIGAEDATETGPDNDVVIDVLLNDIDPERDALRIDSFTPPDVGGELIELIGPSNLPALRYTPPSGASGTATFTYRPADLLGAVGEPVVVSVEIAQPTDDNRAPIVRPDAIRVRRDTPRPIAVLNNDRDPDGDRLQLSIVEPLPPGLLVELDGNSLVVTARAGAATYTPFSYRVDDGNGHVVTGGVLVVVIDDSEPNRPPVATPDSVSVAVGTTRVIDVLANDTDPDGDPLFLLELIRGDGDLGGDIRIEGDVISYTPAPLDGEEAEVDRFRYEIGDGSGATARGEVTVRILPEPVLAPPYAQDDAVTTEVDAPVTFDVLFNDGDPSGVRPTIVGTPGCASGGTARVGSDGRVTYTPPAGRAGVFSCSYEVTNAQGLRDSATIVITVLEPPNDNTPPIVPDIARTVETGDILVVDLLEDAEDDAPVEQLSVLSMTTPRLGVATREGSIVEFEAGTVAGPVSIAFQVGDMDGAVTPARLNIRIIEPIPEPPVARDDARTIVGPAVPTAIDVLANDIDPDGDPGDLRIASTEVRSGPATVSVAGGEIVVDAEAEYVGDVVVGYTVEDPDGLTDTATTVLTVLQPPNRAPVAEDDAAQVVNGGSVTVPIAFNDSDIDGDPLSISIVQFPDAALGSARLVDSSLVFDAVPGASGAAVTVYRVDDGELTDDATVRIEVLPCAVAPPEAPDVFLQTGYQQAISIDLTQYARNGDIVDVGPPLGAATGVYTPPAGENGNIVFQYTVRNSCRIRDVGEVVIDVNQDPSGTAYEQVMGRNATLSIPVSALASDTEPLTITALEQAPSWLTVAADSRSLSAAPNGASGVADAVAVIADPGGLTVRVPVRIVLENQAPQAFDDQIRVVPGSFLLDVLANDRDPDGDPISLLAYPETITFATGGTGTVQLDASGALLIDTGTGAGVGTFTYTIRDSLDRASAPATVTVVVNRAPQASDLSVAVPEHGEVVVALPASDPDGDALTVELLDDSSPIVTSVDGLTLTVRSPPPVLAGTLVLVRYRVTDPMGAVAQATITITVVEPPPPTTTTVPPTTTTTVPPTTTTTTPPTTTTTTAPP